MYFSSDTRDVTTCFTPVLSTPTFNSDFLENRTECSSLLKEDARGAITSFGAVLGTPTFNSSNILENRTECSPLPKEGTRGATTSFTPVLSTRTFNSDFLENRTECSSLHKEGTRGSTTSFTPVLSTRTFNSDFLENRTECSSLPKEGTRGATTFTPVLSTPTFSSSDFLENNTEIVNLRLPASVWPVKPAPYLNERNNESLCQKESSANSSVTVNVSLDANSDIIPLNQDHSSLHFSESTKSDKVVLSVLASQSNLIEKLLFEFQFIKSKINKIESEICEVKTFLGAKDEIVLNPEIMAHLPVKNQEDFLVMEDKLKSANQRNLLIKWLSLKCGSTSDVIVSNIMNNLMVEEFSLCCNWSGANSKIEIKNCWMILLITGVLIKNRIVLTEKQVASYVKTFLKRTWDNSFHRKKKIIAQAKNHEDVGSNGPRPLLRENSLD